MTARIILMAAAAFAPMLIFTPSSLAQVPADKKPPPQVFAATVMKGGFSDRVEALGTLRANESIVLTATVSDTITALHFEDGQRVEKGDVLVEMTSDEESALLEQERAAVEEARRQVARLQPLVKQGAASQSMLDEKRRDLDSAQARLNAMKSRLQDRLITAPFSGVVGLRNISVGALIQPGTGITTLDDDSVMKLDFTVPSVFLPSLKTGLKITAKARAFGEKAFEGTVASIDSQIDPVTRSLTVRALIPNEDRLLKPGLLMSVELQKNPRETLLIPEESVITEARKTYVFKIDAQDGKQTVKRQPIVIGARQPGRVEVLEGLQAGDRVVTHGGMKLSDGAAVSVRAQDTGQALSEMLASPGKDAPREEKAAP